MGVTAETVAVEVVAQVDRAASDIKGYAATFEGSMSRVEASASRAERQIVVSAGASAAATRNLGRQISDIGVGLAGGQSPFLILAQQAPQVADALADTGGKAAKLAAFFAGPWGAALLAAGSIVGVLAGKLLEEGDASDAAKKAAHEHAAAVEDLNRLAGITAHTEEQRAAATRAVARADLAAAEAADARATAQLKLIEALQADPGIGGGDAAFGLAVMAGQAEKAQGGARAVIARTRALLAREESERVLDQYAEMFPLPQTRFGRFVGSGASRQPAGRSRRAATPRSSSGGRTATPSLEDRLRKEAEGSGSYVSADIAAAGSDANALKVTLDSVDTSIAAIRTGLEGVDVGSILTPEESERLQRFSDDFRQNLSSGLAEAIVSGKSLGDVLENSFRRAAAALIESGIEDLLKTGKAGGINIGAAVGSVAKSLGFGRASGGYVAPNQLVRVNEGASPGRVEGFMSPQGGKIVPLGRMAKASGGTVSTTVHNSFDLRGALVDRDVYRDIEQIASTKSSQAVVAARVGAGDDVRQAVRRSLPRSAG